MPWNPQEFRVDTYLTNVQQGFEATLEGAVAYRACTPIPVQLQAGKFKIWNRGDWFRDQARTRAFGGEVELISYGSAEGTYSAQEYGLGVRVDDRERANNALQVPINQNAANILGLQHAIRKSRFFSTQAMVPGVWANNRTGVAAAPGANQFLQWSDDASKPYDDIERERVAMRLATGFRPNVLVLGASVYLRLRRHPQLTALAGTQTPRIVTDDLMRQYFMVDDILVAEDVYNNAMEGALDNFSFSVDPKCALLLYRNQNPAGVATRTALALFGWVGLHAGAANEDGVVYGWLRRPEAYSDQLDSLAAWDMKILDATLGTFFATAIA